MSKYNYTLIIPHYNIPHLLERLLKSIPERDDIQVIVVDDCSPSTCSQQLEEIQLKFPKIEIYSTGINGGGGKARNIGLNHAQGKYLIFADADDYFEPNFNALLHKYCHCNFDIVYFSAILESEEDNHRKYDNYINFFIKKALLSASEKDLKFIFTQPWGKLIRRDLVISNSILFEESIVSNDVRFSTEVDYHAKKLIADSSQCYVWKQRKFSTSKNLNSRKILKRLEIDLSRHKFLSSIKWHDKLNYLEMMIQIDRSGDKNLKEAAGVLCKKMGISKKEILFVRLKRLIRDLFF